MTHHTFSSIPLSSKSADILSCPGRYEDNVSSGFYCPLNSSCKTCMCLYNDVICVFVVLLVETFIRIVFMAILQAL
jgi:hypothetical protein